jgi:hypothetical protein
MNERTDTEQKRAARRGEDELASEELLDPRLTLDAEGDAETPAELEAEAKGQHERPGSAQPARGNRDGGYGANRDRERSMNEPGGFAPGAGLQERDPVAVGSEAVRSPRPGVGQPTGPENTWRERGDDGRVAGDDNRQYDTDGRPHRAPVTSSERPDNEKSAAMDVGTDETSGDR